MSMFGRDDGCPWCGKYFTEDELLAHELGCPYPDPNYNPPSTQLLREFCNLLYSGDLDDLLDNERANSNSTVTPAAEKPPQPGAGE